MHGGTLKGSCTISGTPLFFCLFFLYSLNLAHPAFRDSTLMTSKTDTAFYLLHVSPYSKDPLATANLTNTSQGYACICGKCQVSVSEFACLTVFGACAYVSCYTVIVTFPLDSAIPAYRHRRLSAPCDQLGSCPLSSSLSSSGALSRESFHF